MAAGPETELSRYATQQHRRNQATRVHLHLVVFGLALSENRRPSRTHACAIIWCGISTVCYGWTSRRHRLSRIDGVCLVSLKRDAANRVAAQHRCSNIFDVAIQSRKLGGLGEA